MTKDIARGGTACACAGAGDVAAGLSNLSRISDSFLEFSKFSSCLPTKNQLV